MAEIGSRKDFVFVLHAHGMFLNMIISNSTEIIKRTIMGKELP